MTSWVLIESYEVMEFNQAIGPFETEEEAEKYREKHSIADGESFPMSKPEKEKTAFIVVFGDDDESRRAEGPFDTREEAEEYGERIGGPSRRYVAEIKIKQDNWHKLPKPKVEVI